jgi:lysophospholipase L1-like esterase
MATHGAIPFCGPEEFAQSLWRFHHLHRKSAVTEGTRVVLLGDSRTQGWGEREVGHLSGWWRRIVFTRLFKIAWMLTKIPTVGSSLAMAIGSFLVASVDRPRPALAHLHGVGKVAYAGIGGDRAEHVLWRIEHGELDRAASSLQAVYLFAGINNLMQGGEPGVAASHVVSCARALRARYPRAHVRVQLEFPAHPVAKTRAATVLFNRELRRQHALAAFDERCTLCELDPFELDLDAGADADKRLLPDGVHFSEAGYERWARALAPELSACVAKASL